MDDSGQDQPLPLDYAKPRPVRNMIDVVVRRRWWILGAVILFVVVLPCVKLLCYFAMPHARQVLNGEGRRVAFTTADPWSGSPKTVQGVITHTHFEHDDRWGFFSLRVEIQWRQGNSSGMVGELLDPEDTWRIKFLD